MGAFGAFATGLFREARRPWDERSPAPVREANESPLIQPTKENEPELNYMEGKIRKTMLALGIVAAVLTVALAVAIPAQAGTVPSINPALPSNDMMVADSYGSSYTGGGGGGGGGSCSAASNGATAYGEYGYAQATVQANSKCGGSYTGVAYGHYADETSYSGGGWREKDFDSGCSSCSSFPSTPYSETQLWTSSCYDCTDMNILDADAKASL
jgi:hypothetical protein